jgi:ABC-type iron transport system FetAB ATPase subunit
MISLCTHIELLTHSLSTETWTYRINNQKEKENELTVEYIMQQRKLFGTINDWLRFNYSLRPKLTDPTQSPNKHALSV